LKKDLMMTSHILVTGASGNIGTPLVENLRRAGVNVTAGTPSGAPVGAVAGRTVNFNAPQSLPKAFEGIDTLFLLFPLVPNKLELARNAVNAAKAAGVKYIVRSSGGGADPASPYALLRLQGEIDAMIQASGIACTFVRPSGFMQNYVNYYAGMLKAGALYLPHADGAASIIDVRDIAAVNAVVLQNPTAHAGRAYTITGPQAITQARAVELIGKAVGKSIQYVAVPEAAAQESMRGMGMDDWSIEQMTSLNRAVAAGYAAGVTDTVAQITGKSARGFEAFVKEYADAWR
jgi:uncharacterized protein YbjT (DUF2867 family)